MLKPKEIKKIKSSPTPCDPKRILQAISILKQLNQKFFEKKEKKSLLDDESENPIFLQLTMKKIPPLMMQKFIKVRLPKSILTDQNEVCLITGDLDKRNTKAEVEPDVLHFKELLKKENISQINEVITLRQLRKEYKPFEARRQLCGAYDVFLCDKKIAGVLPHTLGKCFFKNRKLPIQINMNTPKLKEQIENALSSTVFHITCRGNSCSSEVANLTMNDEDILSNVMSSIDALKEHLPGQWDNVLGIYVKTPKSKAIPLYMSNDDPNDFNFAKKRSRPKAVTAELSTLPNTEVKVFRDGRVIVKKSKRKTEDTENPSESDEEYNVSDIMKQSEGKMAEMSFPFASGDDEVNSDTFVKSETKSKKRKSNVASIEESSLFQVEGEKIENSEVEKSEKKSKKRKSNLGLNEEIIEVVENKEVENSEIAKLEKKSKKRKSNLGLNEESIEVVENKEEVENSEIQKSEKKSKKRKSNLGLNEESIEVVENKEVENSKIEKLEKKNKGRKSNLSLNEESIAVVENEVENSKIEKSEKKNKGRKSNLNLNEESSKVVVKEVNIETEKRKKRSENLSSNLRSNEKCSEVYEEKVENSEVVKPGKKSKKGKSEKETTEVAVNKEQIEDSKVGKLEIKSKNQKSDSVPEEESAEVKRKENVKSLSLKRVTRQTKN